MHTSILLYWPKNTWWVYLVSLQLGCSQVLFEGERWSQESTGIPGTGNPGTGIGNFELSRSDPGPGQVNFFHPGPGPGQIEILDPGPGTGPGQSAKITGILTGTGLGLWPTILLIFTDFLLLFSVDFIFEGVSGSLSVSKSHILCLSITNRQVIVQFWNFDPGRPGFPGRPGPIPVPGLVIWAVPVLVPVPAKSTSSIPVPVPVR